MQDRHYPSQLQFPSITARTWLRRTRNAADLAIVRAFSDVDVPDTQKHMLKTILPAQNEITNDLLVMKLEENVGCTDHNHDCKTTTS